MMLEVVGHDKSHFGLRSTRKPVISGDCDHAGVDLDDECQPVDVVNAREPRDLGLREFRMDREESSVYRTRGKTRVKGHQSGGIIRSNRPNMHGCSQHRCDVALQLSGIARGRWTR